MELEELRKKLDAVDDEIAALFLRRMKLVGQVAEYKSKNAVNVEDKNRENEIKKRISSLADGDMKKYVTELYDAIFRLSKDYQQNYSLSRRACLIGESLAHSFSKQIHERMGTKYDIAELKEDELGEFVDSFKGGFFNVTIPYKEKIIPYLTDLDESAKLTGCVNTVVVNKAIRVGYNTDIDGMEYMFSRNKIDLEGKNVVILGTGATSKTAQALCKIKKAGKVTVVGRREKCNYSCIDKLTDTQILINATPVGMFPDCDKSLVDLSLFSNLEFVADVIYNPLRTRLLLQAERLNIPYSNGLCMLVCQAVKSEQIAFSEAVTLNIDRTVKEVERECKNVVLIGMPSCGKSTVGKVLAEKLGKTFVDTDEKIQEAEGMSPCEIIEQKGEEYFRYVEREIIDKYSKQFSQVIATGGGSILCGENVSALKQNSFVVFIERDLSLLTAENRPISQNKSIRMLYNERIDKYLSACDIKVKNAGDVICTAEEIIKEYEKNIGR